MALPVAAKAVEVASKPLENGVVGREPWEKIRGPLEKNTAPEIDPVRDSREFPIKESFYPDIEVIKNVSLQQLVERNKEKIKEIREDFTSETGSDDSIDEGTENRDDNENKHDTEETDEGEKLTEDEINEKQRAAIKEALERIRNGEKLTNEELGNLGEMMMDQYYISKAFL